MKCPGCGADNLEGAAYCEDCGEKLISSVPPSAGIPQAPPQPPPAPAVVVSQPAAAAPAGATVECPACGSQNPATEAYCADCGSELKGVEAVPAAPMVLPLTALPEAPVARLVLSTGGKEFPLTKNVMAIGRKSPADGIYPDIDLTDDDPEAYVSRRHAQISRKEGSYLFEDLGSSNGSFINNVRVSKGVQQALSENDRLRMGKTELVFKMS